jgi:glycerate dehydrogenase
MRIVVLDGYTLNPGDLSWAELEVLGPCEIFDRTPPELVVDRARNAEIVLTNKAELPRDVLAGLPSLQYIGVLATGYNVVDVEAARQRGICVTNVPAYGTASVAQMALAHLLNLMQHVGHHARTVAEGGWSRSPDWCYWDYSLVELEGLTMGVIGLGRIGQAMARLCMALGMKVLAFDVQPPADVPEELRLAGLDEIFRMADAISLHCPLTPETRELVNARRLSLMKPTAVLINTSRGPLVDETALAAALDSGQIAGAGLDVLSAEPPPPDNPLLKAKNCYITPHIAWATQAARRRLLEVAVGNVRAFLDGRPRNVVSGL